MLKAWTLAVAMLSSLMACSACYVRERKWTMSSRSEDVSMLQHPDCPWSTSCPFGSAVLPAQMYTIRNNGLTRSRGSAWFDTGTILSSSDQQVLLQLCHQIAVFAQVDGEVFTICTRKIRLTPCFKDSMYVPFYNPEGQDHRARATHSLMLGLGDLGNANKTHIHAVQPDKKLDFTEPKSGH